MPPLVLTDEEQDLLTGGAGQGVAMAMRVVTALARVRGADRLVEVSGAHVDSCLYHGRAGLDFARRLLDLGAAVRVPTTLNVGSLDLLHPGTVHEDASHPGVLTGGRELMDVYAALGARATWTCAPYQVGARPGLGEHVAWAESNAIVFANSVLGARTDRYGDFLDISAAVTGRAPLAGLHLDAERLGSVVIDLSAVSPTRLHEEMWWGVLGHLVGEVAAGGVPVLVGAGENAGEDALKALGAAAASSGSVGMFHVVGRTPEAPDLASCSRAGSPVTVVTDADLDVVRRRLTTAQGTRLEAVSLGTPHASLGEIQRLAAVLASAGGAVHPGVDAVVSTSRGVLALAREAGLAATVEAGGFRFVVDTCTYVTPVLAPTVRVAMTTSGKWAHYAPGNIGVDVVLGTVGECVTSAVAGRVVLDG
ncbi:aconitase X [Knoellia sp. Soil729]|uniref:aconitase X n=1 Tax=Knoellia sp. Soil729 TaxID=1736394 RepID=UPI00070014B8|nr:aconitase X catalytic domain-containing protein [Knoellia sp. Soil729]KRE41344.1 aconitase subunit 1 [Knoellia sp. Soil729]